MSLTPGFTNDEIVEAVEEYLSIRHGEKAAWFDGKPFSEHQLRRWRLAYLAGTIDRSLVPRHASDVTNFGSNRIRELERELKQARLKHAEELGKLRAENEALQEGTVALGKAIGFLQDRYDVQEPGAADRTDDTPPPASSSPSS